MAKKLINQIKVIIPGNAKEKLDLASKVDAKNTEMGVDSPLKSLTWDVQGPKIAVALSYHEKGEAFLRQAEEMFEQRDIVIGPIDDLLRQSRDQLKVTYRNEPRKIGEFGYVVNDTPAKKKV